MLKCHNVPCKYIHIIVKAFFLKRIRQYDVINNLRKLKENACIALLTYGLTGVSIPFQEQQGLIAFHLCTINYCCPGVPSIQTPCNSQGWARSKPGEKIHLGLPREWQAPQHLTHYLLLLRIVRARSWIRGSIARIKLSLPIGMWMFQAASSLTALPPDPALQYHRSI